MSTNPVLLHEGAAEAGELMCQARVKALRLGL